jgi:hypothetical protein
MGNKAAEKVSRFPDFPRKSPVPNPPPLTISQEKVSCVCGCGKLVDLDAPWARIAGGVVKAQACLAKVVEERNYDRMHLSRAELQGKYSK